MFDIKFYMKAFELKKDLMSGKLKGRNKEEVAALFDGLRSKEPVIYNIETTNACNMRCQMCPRTTMMTRKVVTMDMGLFGRIVGQIEPFSHTLLKEWENFVVEKYRIRPDEMSENHFFLYIIPKVLVLHGYGDPLLDKDMPQRIKLLAKKGIPSYFSCNPANINIDKSLEMFENGLGYIKYSIESVDDARHKEVRGKASDFTASYQKIRELLKAKKKHNYATTIVITMLDLNRIEQKEEFKRLKESFKGLDVYVYLKSQDQQWYQNKNDGTRSIHWLEFCQFPWSSMTIKSNGEAVECVEDYNNEIVLGDAVSQSLYDIWNGQRYRKLRLDQVNLSPGIKCTERCDMKLIGNLI